MTDQFSFLAALRKSNIMLSADNDGRLAVEAPDGALTDEIMHQIKQQKEQLLQYLLNIQTGPAADGINRAPGAACYPLSSSQLRLWIIQEINGNGSQYNIPVIMTLDTGEAFDIFFYREAVLSVVARHEILRTVFREDEEGIVRQWVLPETAISIELPYMDLSDAAEPRKEADRLIEEDKQKGFDLRMGPLIRGMIFRMSKRTCLFYYNLHHIISDGWSMELLFTEVMACYRAFMSGERADLAELDIQYKDYAVWQQRQLQTKTFELHREYWLRQLGGELPVLNLHGGKARPAILTSNGQILSTVIARDKVAAFTAFCGDRRATLFMGLMAVLNALLYRYTGDQDIIVGSPVVGRERPELINQIGFYVNTVVFRTRLSGDDSFVRLLSTIRDLTLAGYEHQAYPFEEIIEEINPPRDTSRSPLFDVMLSLQNPERGDLGKYSVFVPGEILDFGETVAKFDLLFDFYEAAEGLCMHLSFNKDIYSMSFANGLVRHFERLLEVLVKEPWRPLGDVDYLTGEEKEVLRRFSSGPVVQGYDKTVVDLVAEQVSRVPGQPAVVYSEEVLSYRQLDDQSNRLAHYFRNRGIDKGAPVAVCMDRSAGMVVSILAIIKAGGAYVPVDPGYPAERIRFMIEDSGAKLVLTDDEPMDLSGFSNEPLAGPQPGGLAYIMYTSGSTGQPKGVMIGHESLSNYLFWVKEAYLEGGKGDWGLYSSLSFDLTVTSLFGALASGGCLYVFPSQLPIADILRAYLKGEIAATIIKLTPAHIDLIGEMNVGRCPIEKAIVGGEQLQESQVKILKSLNADMRIYNEYGPTEATVGCSVAEIGGGEAPISIGRPIVNTTIRILDGRGNLVPAGVAGELFLGGAGLAKGYWRQETLTAEKFVADPFSEEEGARLYRTGDLGLWLSDGSIQYLGRMDHQVKIRGYRIELGEVEYALSTLPGVRSSLATMSVHGGDNHLTGYITGGVEEVAEMKGRLALVLPGYAIPDFIVRLEQFPVTINGKIDRRALPDPVATNAVRPGRELTDVFEASVQRIWREVLGIPALPDIHSDFFQLGGHSVKLMQLSNRYHREMQVRLSMQQLFRNTTLASHFRLIQEQTKQAYSPIRKVEEAEDYPVSDGQRRLWIASLDENVSRAYNVSGTMPLGGDLDLAGLATIIRSLVHRHEILRTVFHENTEGELRQVVKPGEAIDCAPAYLDAEQLSGQELSLYLQQQVEAVFDLATGPLFRVLLVRLDTGHYQLHYTMHHIIGDARSLEIIEAEIAVHHSARSQGEEIILPPPLRIQYKDYAAWQQEQCQTAAYTVARNYWLEQLSEDLPVLQLATDHLRPTKPTHGGWRVTTGIDGATVGQFEDLCHRSQVTPFMGLLSVLTLLLYRYTGHEDIIIGTPISGRMHAELDHQIGFYLNTLPLRLQFEGKESFDALLQRVKRAALAAYQHQSYSFDRMVSELELERDASRAPLFDIMMEYQEQELAVAEPDRLEEVVDKGQCSVKFDLHIGFVLGKGQLSLQIEYNTNLFERSTVVRLIGHFRQLLAMVSGDPALRLDQVDYLSLVEKKQLFEVFGISRVALPAGKTIVSLFRDQAIRKPEAVAIVAGGERLTYGALEEQSNMLAQFLRKAGVAADSLVPVCVDRSAEMVVGILGILKAGGAYVPVEPAFPDERIMYILKDTGASVCLVNDELKARLMNKESGRTLVDLRHDWQTIVMGSGAADPAGDVLSGQLAYVIYTSGSSGQPKGVMIEHGALTDHVYGVIESAELRECRSFALPASLVADAGHSLLFASFVLGGAVHLLQEELLADGEAIADYLEKNNVDCLKIVPTLWMLYAEAGRIPLPRRVLIFGGETFAVNIVRLLGRLGYTGRVFNHYGPTEATIGKCIHKVDLCRAYRLVPIGRPFSNTQALILDKGGLAVPVGIPGELHISGPGLARGYLNLPLLTSEKFIDNPYAMGPWSRMYRTGDSVRWLSDGNIEYLGRMDDQVKINGHRIEPGEIENMLSGNGSVLQALVVVKKDEDERKRLIAYVVADRPGQTAALRQWLEERLPSFMIPQRLIQLEKMPLAPNGKIDRKALPLPEEFTDDEQAPYVAPAGEKELVLLSACRHVLKREIVKGMLGNFFEAGGDSIKAILLTAHLKQGGWGIGVEDILKYPALGEMAQRMRRIAGASSTGMSQEPVVGEILLTPIQRSFLYKSSAATHHFNQSVLLRSEERLVLPALRESFRMLAIHHDVLRAVFTLGDEGWKQYNRGNEDPLYRLEVYDLRTQDDPVQVMRQHCDGLQQSIKLETGPLLVAGLFRMRDGDRLLIVIHHLVVDGVSWRILLEDLNHAYSQCQLGAVVRLPEKTNSFKEWSERQYQYASSAEIAGQAEYWRRVMENGPSLPATLEQGGGVPGDSKSFVARLDEESTELLLSRVNAAYNTEINDILLTALGIALWKMSGRPEVLVWLEGHGRESLGEGMDITRTVGWFTTVYPVRLAVDDNGALIASLIKIKEMLRRIPLKGMGYGMLRYLKRDHNSSGVDERKRGILFNYLGEISSTEGSPDELLGFADEDRGEEAAAAYRKEEGLIVESMIYKGIYRSIFHLPPDRFSSAAVECLAELFRSTLTAMLHLLSETRETHVTPADLTYSDLSMEALRSIGDTTNLEDIYPLSPMQEGMYYHWLAEPGTTMYIEQVSYRLKGRLDVEALRESYRQLLERHPILRTSFIHEASARPLQVVWRSVTPDFHYLEMRSADDPAYQRFKEQDRLRGFNLNSGSQMRLTIVETGEDMQLVVWTSHHILMDGWCRSILINEFNAIYRGLTDGKPAILDKVHPYVGYIRWLEGKDREESLAYWREYLRGYEKPAAVPWRKAPSYSGQTLLKDVEFSMTGADLQRMRGLCSALQVTEYTFIQSAWGYLLSRYNDTEDVVFGSVVSGRPADFEGVTKMIGLFINTIPVRVRSADDATVGDLLKQLQRESIEAMEHHYTGLASIQDRHELRNSLFDHIMVFENYPVEEAIEQRGTDAKKGIRILQMEVMEEANYGFNILLAPSEKSLYIRMTYDEHLYSGNAIRRVMDHLANMLRLFSDGPEKKLADIDYLCAEERQALGVLSDHVVAYPAGKTIVELLEEQVDRIPERVAVADEREWLTYAELDRRSNRVAHYLRNIGIERGMAVLVCLERVAELVVAIAGILKAGGMYVPVDPSYPEDRIRYMADDVKATLMITPSFMKGVPTTMPATRLPLIAGPTDAAYVIYTSGTTGRPKGVLIEHGSVVNMACSEGDVFGLDDRSLLASSISFDCSVLASWGMLLNGGRLVLCSKEALLDGERMQAVMEEHAVNLMVIPSGFLNQLVDGHIQFFSGLKTVITGGEKLSASHIRKLRVNYPELRIINSYGPTESTVFCLTYEVGKEVYASEDIPIGRPAGNCSVFILDGRQRLLPEGIAGEICVGGVGLAREYWGQEKLTRERFIPHPWRPGERLYRTGDLGKWEPGGVVGYLGRMDEQVKIRGYRIEPAEVEWVLRELPGIESAVVVVRKDSEGKNYLAAYVVGAEASVEAVSVGLGRLLPDHMIPVLIRRLESIPLTNSGKVDKKALPGPEERIETTVYVAPADEKETILLHCCEQILGRKLAQGVASNFFDEGGDSIKSILLTGRIKQAGYRLVIGEILQATNLRTLALGMVPAARGIPEQRVIEGETPLTPVQCLFFEGQEGRREHFNQSVLLYSREPIAEELLRQCLDVLVRHHDALRMSYIQREGRWVQYNRGISGELYFFGSYDLREEHEASVSMERLCNDLQRKVDLGRGPLLIAGVFHLADGDRLLLVIHHLVVDGVSWRILLEDLSSLYRRAREGKRPELPGKSDSFLSWAKAQQEYANSEEMKEQLTYWAGAEQENADALPMDMPDGDNRLSESRTVGFRLDSGVTELLSTRAGTLYGVDLNELLLGLLVVSLKESFGMSRVRVLLEAHGRENIFPGVDVSRTVGWFTAIYPLTLDITSEEGIAACVAVVKKQLAKVPRKGIGYGMLRYLRRGEWRSSGPGKEPGIVFNYLGDFGSAPGASSEHELFRYAAESRGSEVDAGFRRQASMTVSAMIVGGRLEISLGYSRAQFYPATVERLVFAYERLLKELGRIITESGYPLSYNQQYYIRNGAVVHAYGTEMLELPDFDKGRFLSAYERLIGSFPLLRVKFRQWGDVLLQTPLKPEEIQPSVYWMESKDPDAEQAVISEKLNDLTNRPFSLESGEVIRAGVLCYSGRARVQLVIHHIVTDAYSNAVLKRYFLNYYNGEELFVSRLGNYFDFVRLQRTWLRSAEAENGLKYWQRQLNGVGKRSRRGKEDTGLIVHEHEIAGVELEKVREICRRRKLFLSSYVLSAYYLFSLALDRQVDEKGLLAGIVVNGRDMAIPGFTVDDNVGQFANTLPVTLTRGKEMTGSQLTEYVQQRYMEARAHQEIPMKKIDEDFSAIHGFGLEDQFDMRFNYSMGGAEEAVVPSEGYSSVREKEQTGEGGMCSLVIRCQEYADRLRMEFVVVCPRASIDSNIQTRHYLRQFESILPGLNDFNLIS